MQRVARVLDHIIQFHGLAYRARSRPPRKWCRPDPEDNVPRIIGTSIVAGDMSTVCGGCESSVCYTYEHGKISKGAILTCPACTVINLW